MIQRHWLSSALLTAPLAALLACGGSGNDSAGGSDCHSCHGSAANAAPPTSTTGATATTNLGVGAHQVHLQGGPLGAVVPCSECHVVPTGLAHVDGTAKVTFGAFARTGGLAPSWDRAAGSCSNVYCHGSGGTASSPIWTRVDGSQVTCNGCHGNPPTAGGHPQVATAYCTGCHPSTINASGSLVAGGKHLNGSVEAVAFSHPSSWLGGHKPAAAADHGVGCKPCHGDDFKGGTSGQSCWTCHPIGPPI